jgi:Coenzyme PQQ synthesis protein D (PqqD)
MREDASRIMEGGMGMSGATVAVPDHVVYRVFEAETLLLNLRTGQYHGLNETGGRLIELLDECGGSMRQAVERLAAEHEVQPSEIAGELDDFCAQLEQRGLIEVAGRDG